MKHPKDDKEPAKPEEDQPLTDRLHAAERAKILRSWDEQRKQTPK